MQESLKVWKKIVISDCIIGIMVSIVLNLFFSKYILAFLLGILAAVINFTINVFTTIRFFSSENGESKSKTKVLISIGIRIVLVAVFAIILVKNNKYNIFPYVIGYSCNFISILIYGLKLKINEGM